MQLSPPNGRHAEETARRAHARALDAAHKLILKRVLCTMLLLDAAKEARLVPSDPCLFSPSSRIKSTAMMVAEFCRGFLSGVVGSLTQHLGGLGAPLRHEQTALHEYDYTLRLPLAEEARDGARLCRLVELTALAGERQLGGALRLPQVAAAAAAQRLLALLMAQAADLASIEVHATASGSSVTPRRSCVVWSLATAWPSPRPAARVERETAAACAAAAAARRTSAAWAGWALTGRASPSIRPGRVRLCSAPARSVPTLTLPSLA